MTCGGGGKLDDELRASLIDSHVLIHTGARAVVRVEQFDSRAGVEGAA